MHKIDPKTLLPMDRFAAGTPLRIELAYASSENFLFGERIYRPGARLWLHENLAKIVVRAAANCFENQGLRFVLYDGLRTTDAQEAMLKTRRVQDNPEWLEQNLLSMPGMGGHPRGMAVDIGLETKYGEPVDMGTAFDYLAADSSPQKNPAHRDYKNLPEEIIVNRSLLTNAMTEAARDLNIPLLPLPQEWWDFRLIPEFFNQYAPLSDADLPAEMKMIA